MEDWVRELNQMNEQVKSAAIQVVKDVLNDRADLVLLTLRTSSPRVTGQLVNSLIKKETSKGTEIGYCVMYDGYDEKGRPYQIIANSLNRGFTTPTGGVVAGSHFIDKAVSLLKGMDNEINAKWDKEMNK